MSTNSTLTNCRFCSVVSKTSGEDPIGSGPTYERYLLIETAPPWPSTIWMEPEPMPQTIIDVLNLADECGISLRPLVIAPDREYSRPGYIRVFHYYRPTHLFAQFEKQEFIVPEAELSALGTALVQQPDQLPDFEQYRQQTSHIRELFVCTHGNHDAACGKFGYPIYRQLRQEYAADSGGFLRVWRCSHFGGHQFAPTLLDFPEGCYWGHLEPEVLDLLVHRDGSVAGLRRFYRGWAGLTKFEQIAEREIWMQEGWDWFNYHKAGQVLAIDEANEKKYADWAEVRIDFAAPDRSMSGAYEARVEVCAQVMTARWSSVKDEPLETVKQYRVSRLVKVA